MPSGLAERYDFFLSRRGSVASIAPEVEQVLAEKGYTVFTQDYDIPLASNFIEGMHEGIKNSRDLLVLFTADYEQSPYTRMEFTSFEANAAQSVENRRMVILRCEDAPMLGLFAPHVYQNLVGIVDPEERRSRILAAAEGRSQALQPPPRPFIGVPPRIASFTGRTDELDRLDAILVQDKPAAVTQQVSVGRAAVQGMGGVGKTSLAVEYAYRFRGLYGGVCWCPAETRTRLLSALAGLAGTLGAATAEEHDIEKTANAALRRLAEQRATWLLIYDNVTAPDHIAGLLPSAGARVLMTSRFSDWSELADEVAVDVMPTKEAVKFLQSRTGRNDTAGAKALAGALGHLPLALDHAAAYCKRTQMQFGDYAKKASSLIDAAPRGAGYPRSVAATFNLAIAEAVAQCQAAETVMAYLAQCAPERIPMILVEGAVEDETERMEALAVLAEFSLVKHDPFEDGAAGVTVHRLVQMVGRLRAEAQGRARRALQQLMVRIAAIYPAQSGSLRKELLPHLDAIASLHVRPAATAEEQALDKLSFYENVLGPDHPGISDQLQSVGGSMRESDFPRARSLCERALAITEKALGSEHPDAEEALSFLAFFVMYEDVAGARSLMERALAIRDKLYGPEHPWTGDSLEFIADRLREDGSLAKARPLYERALAIYEKAARGTDKWRTALEIWPSQ
jgi:hypothetical protein